MDWKAVVLSIRSFFAPTETVASVALTVMIVGFAAVMLHFHRGGAQPLSVGANYRTTGPAPSASNGASPGTVAQPATETGPAPTAQAALATARRPRVTARPTVRPTPQPTGILPTVTALPTILPTPTILPSDTPNPSPSP